MKKQFALLLMLFTLTKGNTQNIDSLQQLYIKANNISKIELLIQLSESTLKDSFALAYHYGKEAIVLSKKYKNNTHKGSVNNNMGLVFLQVEKYDSALIYFNEAEKYFILDKSPDQQINVMIKQAICLNKLDELQRSIQLYEKAILLAKETNNTKILLQLYSRLSTLFYSQSDYTKGLEFLQEKLKLAQSLNDSNTMAEVYNSISANKRRLGNYSEAIECSQQSLNLYTQLHDTIGIADALMNMGAIYYYTDDYPQAIKQFVKASEIYERNGILHSAAGIYNNIGSVYNETKDYKKAVQYFAKALTLYEKLNYLPGIAIATGNMGLGNEGQGNLSKAMEYYTKSLTYQQKLGNKEGIAQTITCIGGLYMLQGQMEQAKKEYSRALELADENNFLPVKLGIFEKLIDVEEKSGNYKKTVEMMRLHQTLKDSLQNQESREQLNEMQTKLELHEHKAKIDILSKENEIQTAKVEKQMLFMKAIIIVTALFLILIIIILYALNYSKKAKALLQLQNSEISEQRNEIAIKNKQFTDSIKYASRTQNAMLSPISELKNALKDFFIISKPQNIVSGDFYWFRNSENRFYIALADCTGHGVPGAFMSILGHTFLNEIVDKNSDLPANKLLDELRDKIKNSLHQKDYDGNTDGMDISLCIFNKATNHNEFAGAYNPLYIFRNNQLIEIQADKMPASIARNEKPFTLQNFELLAGDKFYLSTDGFYDQFGGKDNSKISRKTFKQLLISNQNLPLQEQAVVIETYFDNWKAHNEQTDDMSILGFEF